MSLVDVTDKILSREVSANQAVPLQGSTDNILSLQGNTDNILNGNLEQPAYLLDLDFYTGMRTEIYPTNIFFHKTYNIKFAGSPINLANIFTTFNFDLRNIY
jgi:hypothetical protein